MRLSYISLLTLRRARRNASIASQAPEVDQTQQVQQAQQPQQTQPHADVSPTTPGPQSTIVSREDITELSQRISELSNVSLSDDRRLVEDIRQRLDKSLLKCWIKLNLPVDEMELVTGIPGTF